MRLRALVAALLALAALAGEPPGRYLFKTYGTEQGFQESGLTSLAQDADGFLWIGSDTGLVRYDGAAFRKWTAQDGLAATMVVRVMASPAGAVWVLTEGGLMRLHKGVFVPVLCGGGRFQPVRGAAMDFDGDGLLWALGPDGLYRQSGDSMVRVSALPQGRGKALACRASSGSVFIASGGSVWELRRDGAWTRYTAQDGLPGDGIEALGVDGEGRLWVVGTRLLRYQDPRDPAFRDASPLLPGPPFSPCLINRGADGTLDIPTNAGLLRLKGDEHEVVDPGAGLPCTWTVSAFRDREGSLWVLGPTLYRQLGRGFARAFSQRDGLPSDLVWKVFRDRAGRLFAGTSEGLAVLEGAGWKRVPGTGGLSVTDVAQDAAGRLLIGASNAPMRILQPGAAAAVDFFPGGPGEERPERSQAVVAGRDGSIWLGDPDRGVFRIAPGGRTPRLEYGPAQSGAPDLTVWQLAEDGRGRLWVASSGGLIIRDEAGWHRFGRAQGLKVDTLNGLALAPDGSAWILYREPVGVARVDYRDGVLRVLESLDNASGLGSNTAYAAAVDAGGGLWLGTDRGAEYHLGAAGLHISRGGGLAGDDCSQNAILVEPGQDVWVGTSTGLAHLLAGRRPAPLAPLTVAITQVVRGAARLNSPYPDLGPVPHRDATLEFRFAAQTYVNEKAVQYQVRLAGLEDDWRGTDVPQARYAALPGGSYRFEVRAAYPGMAFGPVASYAFRVLPPWWATWWVWSLEALAALGAASLVMNRRMGNLARQKERLAGLVDKATRDLQKANQALEKANLALQAQSLSDPLTGLHNRRFLSVTVDDDVAQVQRSYRDWQPGQALPNNDLVFLMVDLDRFKVVNDTHGHHVGDQVLERVAQVLRKAARETDGVIRWGGEEFLVLARNTSRTEAPLMAERIRSLMAEQELVLDSGEVLRWTCSVGYAAYPFCLEDVTWLGWDRVVEIADACLYLAKRAGRDAWAGAEALPGLQRAAHGPRLPWELPELAAEGVIALASNRPKRLKARGRPTHADQG